MATEEKSGFLGCDSRVTDGDEDATPASLVDDSEASGVARGRRREMKDEIHGDNIKDVGGNLLRLEETVGQRVPDDVSLARRAFRDVGSDVRGKRRPPPVRFEEADGVVAAAMSDEWRK